MTRQSFRTESDSMGEVNVPETAYYGAQTARSLLFFNIGSETFPPVMIAALAKIKKAAALTHRDLNLISEEKAEWIVSACDEVIEGKWKDHFPLSIWQTGSGTQTNMNVNEVIANRANQIAGFPLGKKHPVHPNDDVNKSQSTNDVFPAAMHIAIVQELKEGFFPAFNDLFEVFSKKREEFDSIIKIGRTHLMDATPLTFGQEFSGYLRQLEMNGNRIKAQMEELYELPLGGTAVGTGLNAPLGFAKYTVAHLKELTGYPFVPAVNCFELIAAHDRFVGLSGILKNLAVSLMKIANDIRLLGSGPRAGLGELILPENEPGSSIMPGKVNPTQCEALTMICSQVMGNDVTVTVAGSGGHLELNAYKPLIMYNLLQSIRLLADGCRSFAEHCLKNLKVNQNKVQEFVEKSLMLVTALNPHIGYDVAAKIAEKAHQENLTLKEATLQLGVLTEEQFEEIVDPSKMIGR